MDREQRLDHIVGSGRHASIEQSPMGFANAGLRLSQEGSQRGQRPGKKCQQRRYAHAFGDAENPPSRLRPWTRGRAATHSRAMDAGLKDVQLGPGINSLTSYSD